MASEKLINVVPVREKLEKLGEYYKPAERERFLQSFGRFFASRLTADEVYPEGVVYAVTLMFYDMEGGVDGFTGERIPSSLTGQPKTLYAVLEKMILPEIIKAVFEEDDAAQVVAVMKRVDDEAVKRAATEKAAVPANNQGT